MHNMCAQHAVVAKCGARLLCIHGPFTACSDGGLGQGIRSDLRGASACFRSTLDLALQSIAPSWRWRRCLGELAGLTLQVCDLLCLLAHLHIGKHQVRTRSCTTMQKANA